MLVSNWLEQKELLFDIVDGGAGSSASVTEGASGSSTPETPDPAKNQNSGAFSQDDLNKVAAKARTEGKQSALKALLEELGLDSVDSLKTTIETEKKRKEAEMSEAEKLQKALEKALADLKAKDDAIAQTEQTARNERRDSAVKTALRDANVRKEDADDAFILMRERGMLDTLLLEDGKVDSKAVEAAITEFKSKKPAYFAPTSPGSPPNTGGRAPAPDQKDAEKASRGQRNAMRSW